MYLNSWSNSWIVDKKNNHLSQYVCEYVEVVQVCNLLSSSRDLVDEKVITGNCFIIENSIIWSIWSSKYTYFYYECIFKIQIQVFRHKNNRHDNLSFFFNCTISETPTQIIDNKNDLKVDDLTRLRCCWSTSILSFSTSTWISIFLDTSYGFFQKLIWWEIIFSIIYIYIYVYIYTYIFISW